MINNKELLYEIIISKGKGKLTKNAEQMLITLAVKLNRRFVYWNPDDRQDCLQNAIYTLLIQWHKFDETKNTNCFSYFTEIAKRAMAMQLNDIHYKNLKGKLDVVSLNNCFF